MPCNVMRGPAGALVLAALLILGAGAAAQAEPGAASIPPNAHKSRYSGEWQCDDGYRRVRETCVKVVVPEHAYATDSHSRQGWDCARGFVQEDGRCTPIAVPPNAYLVPTATGGSATAATAGRTTDARRSRYRSTDT